jgi:LPXTG-site transpeptidase (sortase) family protein
MTTLGLGVLPAHAAPQNQIGTPPPTSAEVEIATPTSTSTSTPVPTTAVPDEVQPPRRPTRTRTPTPTATDSSGPSPTPTLTPTATETGTAALIVTKSVAPTQAGIGEQFIFTIVVENTGDATAFDIYVEDTFPIFLTINAVTTTKGTSEVTPNRVVVYIDKLRGTNEVEGGESATITILATVNQNVTANVVATNVAYVTYNFEGETYARTSNTVTYYIAVTGTLPGTGGIEIAPDEPIQNDILLISSIIVGLFGLFVLIYGLRNRSSRPKNAPRFIRASIILITVGLVFTLAACGLGKSQTTNDQISSTSDQSGEIIAADSKIETPISQTEGQAGETPSTKQSTLPDYPLPTPDIPAELLLNGETPDTSPLTRIEIPELDLDTIVKYVPFDGLTWLITGLQEEIVWMGDTSWPGLGGNTGLSGHLTLGDGSDGPFKDLADLEPGDVVKLYTEQNEYTYLVREQEIVSDTDFSVVESTDKAQITLITCADWHVGMGVYLSRLVVYSNLIDVQPIVTLGSH